MDLKLVGVLLLLIRTDVSTVGLMKIVEMEPIVGKFMTKIVKEVPVGAQIQVP